MLQQLKVPPSHKHTIRKEKILNLKCGHKIIKYSFFLAGEAKATCTMTRRPIDTRIQKPVAEPVLFGYNTTRRRRRRRRDRRHAAPALLTLNAERPWPLAACETKTGGPAGRPGLSLKVWI